MNNTSTRSFRLDKELSEILDRESDRMGISVNALVNIIIRNYSEFYRFLSRIDMVVIHKTILEKLILSNSEKELYKLGISLGMNIPNDVILFWRKTVGKKEFIEYIDKIMCRYGLQGTYDEIHQNNTTIMIIRHTFGKKGSYFFYGYLQSAFQSLLNISPKFELTTTSLRILINDF